MNTITEIFETSGLKIGPDATQVDVTSALMEADEDRLWSIFDELSCDGPIGFEAEGNVRRTTVAYALAYAHENNITSINQEVVDLALAKATELFSGMTGTDFEPSESIDPEPKRSRTPTLRPEMLQYIKDNPDSTKQEVVEVFVSRYPDKSENTLSQYYHGCRKEAGLNPNGKPGRKKGDTFDIVLELVKQLTAQNPKITVAELKQAVVDHPGIELTLSSAQVYVYRARNEMKTT